MGLLDALYSPDSYSGGGGLLDLIRQASAQNSQYQPASGFAAQPSPLDTAQWPAGPVGAPAPRQFDNAMFDPQTFAPNQAQPIQVGSYQMPRIGDAGQFQPQQAMLPPNAQPTQGQLPQAPQQATQPQQPLPPAFGQQSEGLGGNVLTGLQSFLNGGGLISSIRGAVNGQRADPAGVAQQNLSAQFNTLRQALIQNGETPQAAASKAMVAALNPEAAKTILPELFTNKEKYGVISEDPLVGKKYGFINERDQTVNGKPINAQAQPAASPLADLEAAKASGVTGDALYGSLPPSMRNTVKAMIEGRQPLPSTAAMRSPATLALIDAAHAVDPTFDATSWGARAAGAKDFTSGKSAEMVRAANQTMAHVGSLLDAMDNLKNSRFPAWNAVTNTLSEATGAGEQGAFRTNAHAVAEEMSKVFKGANLSDSEIRHWEQNLSENMSPAQQKAQIAKLSELLHGSLAALEEKRIAAIGPMANEKAGPIIKEEGRKVLERIDNWVKANPAQPAQSTPNKPQTVMQNGHTYTLQPDGSYK